jgi:hypothetical protein
MASRRELRRDLLRAPKGGDGNRGGGIASDGFENNREGIKTGALDFLADQEAMVIVTKKDWRLET